MRLLWLHICLLVCACGAGDIHATHAPRPTTPAPATPAVTPAPSGAPEPIEAKAEPALAQLLQQRGIPRGVIARLDGDDREAACSELTLCRTPMPPASTFKIPNSIIGLETGVIPDAEFELHWDGVTRRVAAWNHDHTLRTAFRDSAVWYYQELARRVGSERMQAWLQRLAYGNMQLGEQIDQFWLDRPLAITPLQQLEFLRRLHRARLPISARSQSIVLDISRSGELDGMPLHGKTGWARPDQPGETGWFVGFLDTPHGPRYVAVAVLEPPREVDMMNVRRALAELALRWPASAPASAP